MIRALTRTAVAAAALAALGGCSLLSSPEPVRLYRFGAAPTAEVGASGAPAGQVAVAMGRPEFAQAARDDRILGVTGTDAAYIAGARWVASADVLFSDALEDAFAAGAQRVRLIGPRELTRSSQTLDVDVRTFEARYPAPETAPTVTIVARVRLLDSRERTVAAERIFAVEEPAAANRVGAIVEAFDAATRNLNGQIVAWTDQNAR
ncbi:MAG: membrane integrity-associated transporter subunit PqiC [Brevundimonas sp.]|uniref:ABC-type transport auxiliary lipoprotein family protein n=1 Tax=Brevundimonas sp. TaxID=1871086 RepID=UPI0017BB7D7B|nr:ABC-type transport auxiliary lipoprotein family protein [Brevundimonas sp.]MBA4805337.1 membrane integrity-associated transporter subunit PqiC [Brevundimonas sp.]